MIFKNTFKFSQFIFSSARIVMIIINVITLIKLGEKHHFVLNVARLWKSIYIIHDEAVQLTFCTCYALV